MFFFLSFSLLFRDPRIKYLAPLALMKRHVRRMMHAYAIPTCVTAEDISRGVRAVDLSGLAPGGGTMHEGWVGAEVGTD